MNETVDARASALQSLEMAFLAFEDLDCQELLKR
jgi:hypothetical protein